MARTFQEMLQLSQTPQDKGFIGNIVSGITQPIKRSFEAARYAASAPGEYTPIFESSTPQDIQSAIEDPTRNVLKTIATGASFAAPGGKSILGKAAGAATSGLLGGVGASEKGDELRAGTTGALVGGGIGLGAGLLGSAVSKIAGKGAAKGLPTVADDVFSSGQKGNKLQQGLKKVLFKTKPKDVDLVPKALDQTVDDITNVFEDISGSKSYVADDIANAKFDILDTVNNRLESVAANTPLDDGVGTKIQTQISEKVNLEKLFKMAEGDELVGEAVDTLLNLPDNPTTLDLIKLNRVIRKAAGGYNKIQGDVGAVKLQRLQIMKDIIRDAVPDDVGALLERQGNMIEFFDNILKDVSKSSTIGAGAIKVPLNLRGGVERAATGIANAPQISTGAAGSISNVGQALPMQTPNIFAALAGGSMGGQQQAVPESMTQDITQTLAGGQPQLSPQQYQAQVFLELLAGGASSSEAQNIAEALSILQYGGMDSGREVASNELARKSLLAQQAGADALAVLQSDPSVTGKTQGVENFFNNLLGASNTATDYNQKIETFRTLFMSALGGATLPPQEIARFEKSLPKVTDSPERAQQKIENLLPYLDSIIYEQ